MVVGTARLLMPTRPSWPQKALGPILELLMTEMAPGMLTQSKPLTPMPSGP